MGYTTYHSRETVKARKVTDKDGETVVTNAGPVIAARGDYVIETDDGTVHMQGEEFETRYRTNVRKTTAKKAPAKKTAAPRKASAADRVRKAATAK
jgi:hypothetical protein